MPVIELLHRSHEPVRFATAHIQTPLSFGRNFIIARIVSYDKARSADPLRLRFTRDRFPPSAIVPAYKTSQVSSSVAKFV
jgi:hypothetical protein